MAAVAAMVALMVAVAVAVVAAVAAVAARAHACPLAPQLHSTLAGKANACWQTTLTSWQAGGRAQRARIH